MRTRTKDSGRERPPDLTKSHKTRSDNDSDVGPHRHVGINVDPKVMDGRDWLHVSAADADRVKTESDSAAMRRNTTGPWSWRDSAVVDWMSSTLYLQLHLTQTFEQRCKLRKMAVQQMTAKFRCMQMR